MLFLNIEIISINISIDINEITIQFFFPFLSLYIRNNTIKVLNVVINMSDIVMKSRH